MTCIIEKILTRSTLSLACLCGLTLPALSAAKVHVVALGKSNSVPWPEEFNGADAKPSILRIRPLLVDNQIKELTLGPAHEVTDRLFVIRRAFRVNDRLPQEPAAPHWQWQRGGWLLVDRLSGRISSLNLPEFDPFYSTVSWYRDYAAYCGVSEDGKKIFAIVAQITRRKPVLKKTLEGISLAEADDKHSSPDSLCPEPEWQRSPARVSFDLPGSLKQTYAIRGHVVDLITEEEDEEAEK
jgi:hypothetical protein